MDKKKYTVFLGFSSFPYGFAEFQKILLISKCLQLTSHHVTVIGRNGLHDSRKNTDIKVHGYYEDIEYIYTSGSAFRNDSFIKRRLFEIKGKINEVKLLRKRAKQNKLDYAILSTRSFNSVLLYSILSKLFGFKIILNYVEYYSGIKKKSSEVGQRINDTLFDKFGPRLADAVFPISEFLINQAKKVSSDTRYFKIPGLTDFERYNNIEKNFNEKYFLFCGHAAFDEIIKFIIDSFGLLENQTSYFLYLVISGKEHEIAPIKEYVNNHSERERIKIFSHLSEKQLFTYYKNAQALLIPLRPTFQDMARFPHKTGEYMASGNPVISTNYGEMKHYFKDMENMLLADSYDKKLFAEKMQFVIDNAAEAQKIGLRGKEVASQLFDYRNRAAAMNEFLDKEA